MKIRVVLVTLLLFSVLFTGCKKNTAGDDTSGSPTPAPQTTPTTAPTNGASPSTAPTTTGAPDAVTTASIVNTEEAFIKAISSTGTWIIATLNDMTINQELVLEGEFKNGKKDDAGNDVIQRKLAFYTQDEDRNITGKFVLTAPKLTIRSPQASIQHGAFVGDLYVDVDNFQLVDATIDGNVYFTKQAYKDSFTMDGTSSITGTQSVQQ